MKQLAYDLESSYLLKRNPNEIEVLISWGNLLCFASVSSYVEAASLECTKWKSLAEITDCLQATSTGQLLHHCSASDYSGNYSTTLTSAILSWKLNPIFSELLVFWAWICRVHKQAQACHGWGGGWATPRASLRTEGSKLSWCGTPGHIRRGVGGGPRWGCSEQVSALTYGHTAEQWLVRVRKEVRGEYGTSIQTTSLSQTPQEAKYDGIPASRSKDL